MDIILQSALIVAVALVVLLAILVVNDMTHFTCNVVSGAWCFLGASAAALLVALLSRQFIGEAMLAFVLAVASVVATDRRRSWRRPGRRRRA